jgi:hypothetical protein
MIVLGIILIVLGLLLPSLVPTFAFAHLCLVIGVILLVVGLLLMVAGRIGTRRRRPPPLLLNRPGVTHRVGPDHLNVAARGFPVHNCHSSIRLISTINMLNQSKEPT